MRPIPRRELAFEMLKLLSPLVGSIAFAAIGATSVALSVFLFMAACLFLLHSVLVIFYVPFACFKLAERLVVSRAGHINEERSGLEKGGLIWLFALGLWLIQLTPMGLIWIALGIVLFPLPMLH